MRKRHPVILFLFGIGYFFEAFFLFIYSYAIISILGGVIGTGTMEHKEEVFIYVQSNGVHTDVVFPSKTDIFDWTELIPTKDYPRQHNFDYVAIGWGDKGFFLDTPTWADLTASTALKAAFTPSATAMHVSYTGIPEENEDRIRIGISKEEYQHMVEYAKSTFSMTENHVMLIPERGYWDSDNFYEAKDSYHLFRTCNRWTNEALKAGNVATGVYSLFPKGIMRHLRK